MSIAYFDCFSGIAGDMVLGALVDLGLPLRHLKSELSKLDIGDYSIKRVKDKDGIKGTNIVVDVRREPPSSMYVDLDRKINRSDLSDNVKEISRDILRSLAGAEGKVHRRKIDKVHFHEVGTVDSLVDIVGSAIGFDYFGFDAIYSSPLPMTRGRVKCAHGILPVPAPATMELLKGVPVERCKLREEIVTPTGAAIITTVAEDFCECPIQVVKKIGYGFGDKVLKDMPNVLRIVSGEGFPVVVIQTNIDDMNPELFDHLIDELFKSGAVDVDLAPVQMKKNRPAIKLSVLSPWDAKDDLMDIILTESSSFGVKYWPVDRKVLKRKIVTKTIKRMGVRFKVGFGDDGRPMKAYPEYEDVKKFAKRFSIPIQEAYIALLSEGRDIEC